MVRTQTPVAGAGVDAVGSVLTSVVSTIVTAIGEFATVAAFDVGGYTGLGHPQEPAGVVHRGEFVFNAGAVNRIGLPDLHALHAGRIDVGAFARPKPIDAKAAATINRYFNRQLGGIMRTPFRRGVGSGDERRDGRATGRGQPGRRRTVVRGGNVGGPVGADSG